LGNLADFRLNPARKNFQKYFTLDSGCPTDRRTIGAKRKVKYDKYAVGIGIRKRRSAVRSYSPPEAAEPGALVV
jgi:hypothetical protein